MAGSDPQPLGFGRCPNCPFLQAGTAAICYACASDTITGPSASCCDICDQTIPPSGRCSNFWCHRDDRFFDWIYAIAMHTGVLRDALAAYKYNGRRGWARIFGRVLVGYLDARSDWFGQFDMIISSPTFVGERRTWDHIGEIVRFAELESDGRWPFDLTDLIVKERETESLVGKPLRERRRIAEEQIGPALRVPDPDRIRARSVLVFDDVFTDGSTLREIARRLKESGATTVAQVTLARAPWRQ